MTKEIETNDQRPKTKDQSPTPDARRPTSDFGYNDILRYMLIPPGAGPGGPRSESPECGN